MFGLSAVDLVVEQQYTFTTKSVTVFYMRESFICDIQGYVHRRRDEAQTEHEEWKNSLRTRVTSIYNSFSFRPTVCSACHR